MDRIFFAKGQEMPLSPEDNCINLNQIICGCTGSGKTFSYVEPILSHVQDTNLVITLTKDRLYHFYKDSLEERGFRIYHLDLAHPEQSTCRFDPSRSIRTPEDLSHLARFMIEITQSSKATADTFWNDQSIMMMEAFLGLLDHYGYGLERLPEIVSLADPEEADQCACSSSVDYMFMELEADHPARRRWEKFRYLSPKTYSCIIVIVHQAIQTLLSTNVLRMLKNNHLPELDFERFAGQKAILFITTSPVNPSLHCYANLLYSQMFKTLFEFGERQPQGRLPRHIHLIGDDFCTGSKVPNFEQMISIFRETGISVSMLIQDQSQLSSLYGKAQATTITNNCDTYLYYGGIDIDTCEMISRKVNRPFEQVFEMPAGYLWIIQRGSRARMVERYPILEDPVYQQIRKAWLENTRSRSTRPNREQAAKGRKAGRNRSRR